MNTKRRYLVALSLAGIGAIGAFASVSAASLQPGTPTEIRNKVQTAIKQAFTSGDYQAYLETTKDYKVGAPVLTGAQFNAVIQANKLRASGDTVGAKKLLDGAGIKPTTQNNKETQGISRVEKEKTPATGNKKTVDKTKIVPITAGTKTPEKKIVATSKVKKAKHSTKKALKTVKAPTNSVTQITPTN